jgi:1-acyl-sn-glycerol-3-phosphate acyltransferase
MRVSGLAPGDVLLVAPHALLKTSSGKIRRVACRDLHLDGKLAGRLGGGLGGGILGAVARSATLSTRRTLAELPASLYSLWAWSTAGVLLTVAWCGVMVLPRPEGRWRWARAASRAFFSAAGLSIEVTGTASSLRRHPGGLVLAANHASFLDSMILIAALDRPLSFVAKRRFERNVLTRRMMRRLGTTFVDREDVDPRHGLETWTRRVERGEALVVFVEGTFTRSEGLRPFKLGAFEVALRSGRSLVPVVLSGSRELLPDGEWRLRRAPLEVRLCAPLEGDPPEVREAAVRESAGSGLASALRLSRLARQSMLTHLREPDLEVAR